MKWTEVRTTLQSAAQVSQLWRSAASSEELWRSLLEAANLNVGDLEAPLSTALVCYRSLWSAPRALLFLEESLEVFNCGFQTFEKPISLASQLSDTSAVAVFLPSQKLLLCGLGRANCVSLLSGGWEEWQCMLESRGYHSALYLSASVYAFGGRDTNTAERYCFRRKQWLKLPPMLHSRNHFTACNQNTQIYLCGGHTPHSEVFDTVSERYTKLPFQLPSNWTVSCIYKQQLVCIVLDKIHRIQGDQVQVTKRALALIP